MNERPTIVRQPATYQDVLDAPENMVAELIDGTLYLQPRPASPHARMASGLGGELYGPYDRGSSGPGGWWILDEPELHFGADVLVPDLAGWRRERMPRMHSVASFDLAPDWVCEVASPSTRRLDRSRKRDIYAAAGVRYLWLVEPVARTLEVFELRDGLWSLLATIVDEGEHRIPPFETVPIDLTGLWAEDDQGEPEA
ncbi:MAG: Uma2 family endonuclease [Amaricoccus sp.]|uniref:Uma2 family endonuclease n=1 Tax=Amaricoccus sp. TaxID=1872485 RepID=UPI0039E42AC8